VGEVRRALGDRPGEERLVRTVQRFGYAFVGEVSEDGRGPLSAAAAGGSGAGCALMWGDRIVPLATGENVVGRDPEAVLTIPSGLVSRRHASIVVAGERATLRDLGSKNGTNWRERGVTGEVELADGDEIRIGPARLVFCAGAVPPRVVGETSGAGPVPAHHVEVALLAVEAHDQRVTLG
jgi:hypothetical protein